MNGIELAALARRLNDRETVIQQLKERTLEDAARAMGEVLLQGKDLSALKGAQGHGKWLIWLGKNCPRISTRTAQVYMRLAGRPELAADIISAGSVRKALGLLEEPKAESKEPKQWPAYLEAIGRLGKLIDYVRRSEPGKWPKEGQVKFKGLAGELLALVEGA